jgi:hypothetical protein
MRAIIKSLVRRFGYQIQRVSKTVDGPWLGNPFAVKKVLLTRLDIDACRRQVEAAGIWFVDIPRTGSTSLKLALAEQFGSEFGKSFLREDAQTTEKVILDHTTARRVRQILSPELWNRLFTFSIVRNPWDRCYSLFRYRIANNEIPAAFPFSEYLTLLERKNTRRHPYTPFRKGFYFMPMCDFVLDEEDKQLVSYIGRFEEREECMLVLREKTGVEFSGSRRAEVIGQPGDYRKAYCNEGMEIVARIYRDDIERFRYQF